jgi:BirA family biotin operon repressor/biotin-[acetyl-CoA-carboxylase] ligase
MSAAQPLGRAPARIVEVEETASTNRLALQLGAGGERGPLWITAVRQTAGRGRSGRTWTSLPGNLHATLLLVDPAPVGIAAQLSLVAGLAAVDAVRRGAGAAAPAALRVKWPNDVLVAEAKLGGVLIESSAAPVQGVLMVAVGVGLNLAVKPLDADRAVTCLAEHGAGVERGAMLAHLAGEMAFWLEVWDQGRGFDRVRAAWLERAGPVGERISVNTGHGTVIGRYIGLDATGALLMADAAGVEQRFTFGDVTLLGASPPGGPEN